MFYTDSEGNELKLPKYTAAVAEEFDRIDNGDEGAADRTRRIFKLMSESLGSEYVAERCGGKTAKTVDLSRLEVLYSEVRSAYRASARAAQVQGALAELQEMAPLLEALERVAALEAKAKTRSGFKKVY